MIAIIDYNAGNIASVANALERLNERYVITDNPDVVRRADKIIFPGVGAARAAMTELKKQKLDTVLRQATQPVLGICLGLQFLAERSEEGDVECLGILPNTVVKRFPDTKLKVPQVGWNKIEFIAPEGARLGRGQSRLQANIVNQSYFYFIHSYYLPVCPWTVATSNYGVPFSAMIRKDNFFATQFHPEKSGAVGSKLLSDFCNLC